MIEANDDSRGRCNTNTQFEFENLMLKSHLWDYSDAYILVNGITTITRGPADATDANKQLNESNKTLTFKNFASFSDYISEINNTKVDDAENLDVNMFMYNSVEYNHNYSKTAGRL